MTVAKKQAEPHSPGGDQYAEKLERLISDYGIESGDYYALALRLAIDCIPGFLPTPGRLKHGTWGKVMPGNRGGRPTKWSQELYDELLIAVDNAKKMRGISTDDDALKQITQHGKWARPARTDLNKWLKTLKNALASARKIQREVDHLLELLEEIKRENPEKLLD